MATFGLVPLLPLAIKQQVQAHRSEGSGELVTPWRGSTVEDLHREYSNIFKYGNRNAASHLWSTFLLDRARFLTTKTFLHLASGYCAISGSPVHPSAATRYRMSLEHVDGSGKVAGSMFYCCWPCVCDTNDFIRVDTKSIVTADEGLRAFNVTVIGDPCVAPGMLNAPFLQPFDKRMTTIAHEAREVRCGKQGLEGATYSDHGFVIIGLYFAPGRNAQDGSSFEGMCEDRANAGYNSGMGEIFRQVAAISPVEIAGPLVALGVLPPRRLADVARRGGVATRGLERQEIISALQGDLESKLRRLKPKALRAAAARLGVSAPPVATKQEKAALVSRLAESLRELNSLRSMAERVPPLPTLGELRTMTARELQAEADRRGLDRRQCLERVDLLQLLALSLDEGEAEHVASVGAVAKEADDKCGAERHSEPREERQEEERSSRSRPVEKRDATH